MARRASGAWVEVGRVAGVYGVRGWLRIQSHTDVPSALLDYRPWRLRGPHGVWDEVAVEEAKPHGRGFLVRLAACESREDAERYRGAVIEVPMSVLPALAPGEFYWAELVGLAVETLAGQALGVVRSLLATGANDVLIVTGERERLIPYVPEVVRRVDLDGQRLVVAWDPDF